MHFQMNLSQLKNETILGHLGLNDKWQRISTGFAEWEVFLSKWSFIEDLSLTPPALYH